MRTSRRPLSFGLALVVTSVVVMAAVAVAVGPAQAAPVTITNGTRFSDTGGNAVQAHGGGVLKVGEYYYWFGENRNPNNTFRAVSVYRSTNLRDWQFRSNVLTQSSASELQVANIERPKVIYNASTGRYVMWMHKENGSNYSEARAAVASSATVDGSYTYHGSFRPLGQHMSRDITLYNDNGTAYMISAAQENYDLHIYRLTADYLNVATLVGNFWNDAHREARAAAAPTNNGSGRPRAATSSCGPGTAASAWTWSAAAPPMARTSRSTPAAAAPTSNGPAPRRSRPIVDHRVRRRRRPPQGCLRAP